MISFLTYLFHLYLNYIIIVPVVLHPTKLQYLHFELILGDFAPALLEVSFGMIFRMIPQSIRDKPSKKMFSKALIRWYLAQY